jgi:high-affinity iron transporter
MKLQSLSTILLIFVVVVFSLTPHAAAQGNDPTDVDVPAELAAIHDLLQEAMRAYRLGDFEKAYEHARAAYLDHFELVELPLRVIDPDLTLDLEYRFADLRTNMQAGAPADEVEQSARSVRDGLNEIEPMFTEMGALAPILAFVASFTIIFREGLEAVLVIAALMGYLQTGLERRGRRYVGFGVGLALVATALTWGLLRFVVQVAPVGRELLEAIISFVAVGVLFWVSFWLVSRLDRQRRMEFLSAKAWATMRSGSMLGLLGLGFTAVYREGFETVLFYEVLLNFSRRVEGYVLLGFLAGVVALGVVAWLILRAGRQLPIRVFMRAAVTIVILLSVAFIGNGVRELQETGLLNATSLIGSFPRLPRLVAELTGIHPTVETLAAQVVLLSIYILGGVVMWWQSRSQPSPIRFQEAD